MNRTPTTEPRYLRIVAVVFGLWLIGIAALDARLNPWWRYVATLQVAFEQLRPGSWHANVLLHHLKAIVFWVFFMLASLGLGMPFAAYLLGKRQTRFERWLMGLLLGMTGLGLLVFLLGIAHLWGKVTAPALLGFLALQAVINIARERQGLLQEIGAAIRSTTILERILIAISAIAVVLVFLYALSPPVQSDALRYHLAAPDRWRQLGRIVYLSGFAHSNLPFLVEMNFALALLLGIPEGSQLVHFTYLIAAAGVLGLIAQRLAGDGAQGRWSMHASLAAALLLLTHPVAAPVSAWPYVDVASLAYTLAMIWALMRWIERPGPRILALAAIMGGGAFACKYTNLLPIGLAGLVILLLEGRDKPIDQRIKAASLAGIRFGVLAVLICAPWLIRNAVTTGNPVYPLAYSIFNGPDWSQENAAFYSTKAGEKGTALALLSQKSREGLPVDSYDWFRAQRESLGDKVKRLVALPWNTYRWSGAFEGFPQGPLLLIALIPAVLMVGLVVFRRPTADSILCGLFIAFLFATWAATYQSNRFLLPVPALLAALLGAWATSRGSLRISAMAAVVFLIVAQSSWVAQFVLTEPQYQAMRPVFGRESREHYLARTISYYDAAQWLNEKIAPKQGVFLAGEHRTYYMEFPVLGADWFDTPAPLRLVREARDANHALDLLKESSVSLMLLNARELFAGAYLGAVEDALGRESNAAARRDLLLQLLEKGPASLMPDAPALGEGGSNYDYFRRRFNDQEWQEWMEILRNRRLKQVYESEPLIGVYQIK